MKKLYLFLGLMVILVSCEKEEVSSGLSEESLVNLQELQFKDLPSKITQHFDSKAFLKLNGKGKGVKFGSVRKDYPVKKILDEEGNISYTFALRRNPGATKKSSSFYFDNLVVFEDENEEAFIHIIRYEPTEEWYKNSRNFEYYSGKVTFFTQQGEKTGSLHFSNGTIDKAGEQEKGYVAACYWNLANTQYFYAGAEGSMIDSPYTVRITYTYEYKCDYYEVPSSGGGGDYGDTPNDGPPPPGELPSIGGGGTTTPILPEPEEESIKVISELEGKADCIFGKLTATALNNHNIFRQIHLDFGDHITYLPENIIYRQESGLMNEDGIILNGKIGKEGDNYIVTLNSDRVSDRAAIEVAKTLLHESVHAILRRRFNLAKSSFIEAFRKHIEEETGSNDISHSIMRQYYINPMARNLQQFDRFSEDWSFYTNLAWEGLHQNLSEERLTEIAETIEYLRNREGGLDCD